LKNHQVKIDVNEIYLMKMWVLKKCLKILKKI